MNKKIFLSFICIIKIVFLLIPGIIIAADLDDSVEDFAEKGKKYKIAVSEFKNTSLRVTKYDGYIADTLVHELSKHDNFKVIERTKLNTVLSELELTQTGVINPDQAKKIGKILAVDLIATGSYTIIGSQVSVNIRFINVSTGEIVNTIAYSFEHDKEAKVSKSKINKDDDDCSADAGAIYEAMKDMSSKDKIDRVIKMALAIPYSKACAKIHYRVMSRFRRYKISSPLYKKYLINSILNIENPSDDNRVTEVLYFFRMDNKIDHEEWQTGLIFVKRGTSGTYHNYLNTLLNIDHEKNSKLIKARLSEVLKLAEEKKIGKPVRFSYNRIFSTLLHYAKKNIRAKKRYEYSFYLLDNFIHKLTDDQKSNNRIYKQISSIYNDRYNPGRRKDALNVLVKFLSKVGKNEHLAKNIYHLATRLEFDAFRKHKPRKHAARDFKFVTDKLGGWICFLRDEARLESYKNRISDFIKKYKIRCK